MELIRMAFSVIAINVRSNHDYGRWSLRNAACPGK